MEMKDIKKTVRDKYGKIVKGSGCCQGKVTSCCDSQVSTISKGIGYSDGDLAGLPDESNLGLGCGNPVAIASIQKGETVLDLGSGAGIDCFLASPRVGPDGRVIGVDMTPEMLERARENAAKGNYSNVEFRLGEIENLPVADDSVDLIISNCVINLSPEKERVFKEAFRVLKPGGRLMVSDIVVTKELPESVRTSVEAYVGCIAGAIPKEDYLQKLGEAGFAKVDIVSQQTFPGEGWTEEFLGDTFVAELGLKEEDVQGVSDSVLSISVSAKKPD